MEQLGLWFVSIFGGVFGGAIGFLLIAGCALFLGLPFVLMNLQSQNSNHVRHWSD
jgi:hypothetical protein